MPATFETLLDGYVIEDADGTQHVRGTVGLVRSGDLVMVVDPGMMAAPELLTDELAARGLTVEDVTHVFVSHHHLDHTRNIGLFPRALVIDTDSTYNGDVWGEHDGDGYAIAEDVVLLQTPGHSAECASLLVRTADRGAVVYTHAWWLSDMTPEVDPLAFDQEALERSRARILTMADVIVPAHGAAFPAPR